MTPVKTHYVTNAELVAMITNSGEHPADIRENMRAKLHALPNSARAVYDRENIHDPRTPLLTVIETVLYAFDNTNRHRVADALGLEYDTLITLLIGYVIGYETTPRRSPGLGE